jgi:predicted alpha/beta superfamily hydrolase
MLVNQIRYHHNFYSSFLGNSRSIAIYLPADYGFDTFRRYSVLYLQDGQNLFDPAASFAGVSWRADETAQELIWNGKIDPLIIVGVYNTGENRINEYTPTRGWRGQGGNADNYGRFLIEELKPFIDQEYRTMVGREFTGIGGSSLGGLLSLYLGLRRADIFGKIAAISPSVWWGNGAIFREVNELYSKLPTRIWLDIGSREGVRIKSQVRSLRDAFLNKGWQLRKDLSYLEARRGQHNEAAWAARFDRVLQFLFKRRKRLSRFS